MKLLSLNALLYPSIFLLTAGCAHTHKIDGEQVSETIPAGIRVRIGSSEVKNGDQIQVLKKTCEKHYSGGHQGNPINICHDNVVAKGQVLKVLDHDSAIVQIENGFKLEPDMTVEKSKP